MNKKKLPKKQVEEEKVQADKLEISSDECLIQDDEIEKQEKLLKGVKKRQL